MYISYIDRRRGDDGQADGDDFIMARLREREEKSDQKQDELVINNELSPGGRRSRPPVLVHPTHASGIPLSIVLIWVLR